MPIIFNRVIFFRLVQSLKESPSRGNQLYQGTSKITMAHDAIQAIKQLRRDVVETMRSLMKLAKEKQTSGMLAICEDMISKTRILLSLWDPGLVEEALTFLEEHKVAKVADVVSSDIPSLDFKAHQTLSPFKRITQQLNFDLKSPDFDEFVTPDTPECVHDIWAKESTRSNLANFREDNFVIFPEVEEEGKLEDDEKSELDLSKRFLDMQKMCSSPSANYYKPTDEPEPWDLTQLNIEASVMCLVSKVKFLCGRCSSPAVRLRSKNSLCRNQIMKDGSVDNCVESKVVTTQPKNGIKSDEAGKLLENANGSLKQMNSPGSEKPVVALSKAKEGEAVFGREINFISLHLSWIGGIQINSFLRSLPSGKFNDESHKKQLRAEEQVHRRSGFCFHSGLDERAQAKHEKTATGYGRAFKNCKTYSLSFQGARRCEKRTTCL